MNGKLMSALVAILVLTGTSSAQQRPDFSGTWLMDASKSQSPTYLPRNIEQSATVIIEQTPATMRIETRWNGESRIQTFRLEGDDEPKPVGTSGSPETIKVSWEGDTLVIATVDYENKMAMKKTVRRTLDPAGKAMTVETSVSMEHAYAGSTAKDIFTKVDVPSR